MDNNNRELYLAGGCFWGVQAYLSRIEGVISTAAGYANGRTAYPSYEEVCYKNTGHAETVQVSYDSGRLSLPALLEYYFRIIDPVSVNRQGNDTGSQYRTGVYYTDPADEPVIRGALDALQAGLDLPVAVELKPLARFYPAEAYHQNYLAKNPHGYCHIDLSLAEKPAAASG